MKSKRNREKRLEDLLERVLEENEANVISGFISTLTLDLTTQIARELRTGTFLPLPMDQPDGTIK